MREIVLLREMSIISCSNTDSKKKKEKRWIKYEKILIKKRCNIPVKKKKKKNDQKKIKVKKNG